MTVKAVILDLDGTLIDEVSGKPVPGIEQMLEDLHKDDLKIAVASNKSRAARKLKQAGLEPDFLLTRSVVKENKGSPKWVYKACEAFSVESNELLILGDSDLDMRTAVNARVIYFHAGWSKPSYRYGILVREPWVFRVMVREFFMKSIYWYWWLQNRDSAGRPIAARAMVDSRGAGIDVFQNDLVQFLKEGGSPRVGRFSLRGFVMLHLLGSIYGSGLYRRADTWTTYPGSGSDANAALGPILFYASRLFRDRYVDYLFIRHRHAVDSGEARRRGERHLIDFPNQINTVHLNEQHRSAVEDKAILVVDDFETEGYSMECARNLLLEAGASEVMCVSISKYRKPRFLLTPADGYTWDPFVPVTHAPGAFDQRYAHETRNNAALGVIRQSYQRLKRT